MTPTRHRLMYHRSAVQSDEPEQAACGRVIAYPHAQSEVSHQALPATLTTNGVRMERHP